MTSMVEYTVNSEQICLMFTACLWQSSNCGLGLGLVILVFVL